MRMIISQCVVGIGLQNYQKIPDIILFSFRYNGQTKTRQHTYAYIICGISNILR